MSMTDIIPLMDMLKVFSQHYTSMGDYSVTGLIDTPRRIQLYKRHKDQLIIPPESQAAAMVGVAVHKLWEDNLRQYSMIDPKYEVERVVTEKIADRLVTGRFDVLYNRDTLYDIKTCKVWKRIFDPTNEEWTEQLNLYHYLLGLRGVVVKKIYVIAHYMDWIESQMVRDKEYPRAAIEQFEIEIWPKERQENYLHDRLALHKSCEEISDDELPVCSRKERWERHPGGATVMYAILKSRSANRAINNGVFDSLDAALERFKSNPKGITSESVIECRYAVPKKCLKWCAACNFCDWYIDYCKKDHEGTMNDYFTHEQIHSGKLY